MVAASLYIVLRSARNRAALRLRRLREPRYLLGAIAGAAYFYLSFFRLGRGGRPRGGRPRSAAGTFFTAMPAAAAPLAGLVLSVGAGLSWVLPLAGTLADLSNAEVQFLVTAPVSSRQLLLHRLMRTQVGLLFASIIPAIVLARGAGGGRVRVALGTWILLATARLFVTGVGLVRRHLNDADRSARARAWIPLGVTTGVAAVILRAAVRPYLDEPGLGLAQLLPRVDAALRNGAAGLALQPFMALARPLLSTDWSAFARALPWALLVLGGVLAWVLSNDRAFAAAIDGAPVGQSAAPGSRYTVRGHLALAPAGRHEGAFVWKAATETARSMNLGLVSVIVLPVLAAVIAANASGLFPRGVSETLAGLVLVSVGFCVFMGPQILRLDLRRDLEHLPMLRTWPVPPGAVVRGEMVWPALMLTGLAWALVGVASVLVPVAFPGLPLVWRLSLASAAALTAPGLIAAQYVIHNAAALTFPAWVSLGRGRPRGFDAMGQRLILLAGTWLALLLMVAPGAISGAIVWYLSGPWLGPMALVPAAVVGSTALLAEAAAATEALGLLYARVEATDLEQPE